MLVKGCQMCKYFLGTAQTAVMRHIDAQSKLRMAHMRYDREAIPALEAIVEAGRLERAQALAELEKHLGTHPAEPSAGIRPGRRAKLYLMPRRDSSRNKLERH